MKSKTSSVVETITPQIAQMYLTHNVINRKKSDKTIDTYAIDMKEGRWRLNGDAIRFSKSGNLLDGQHRLMACLKAGVPFNTYVTRGLDEDCFVTIDNGKIRSAGDIFTISDIPNSIRSSVIVKKYIKLQNELLIMSKADGNGSGMTKITNSKVLDVYNQNKDLVRAAVSLGTRCYDSCRPFSSTDIGGIYCYLVNDKHHLPEEVVSFFEQLCDIKPAEYNMLRSCRKIFVNDKSSNARMVGSVRQALLIKAWNYFVRKKDVVSFKYNNLYDKNIWFI